MNSTDFCKRYGLNNSILFFLKEDDVISSENRDWKWKEPSYLDKHNDSDDIRELCNSGKYLTDREIYEISHNFFHNEK